MKKDNAPDWLYFQFDWAYLGAIWLFVEEFPITYILITLLPMCPFLLHALGCFYHQFSEHMDPLKFWKELDMVQLII